MEGGREGGREGERGEERCTDNDLISPLGGWCQNSNSLISSLYKSAGPFKGWI